MAYGLANRESRLLSFSLEHLESLLDCDTAASLTGEVGLPAVPRIPDTCGVCFQNDVQRCTDCELGRRDGGRYGEGVEGDWSACSSNKACSLCGLQMGCYTAPKEKVIDPCLGCLLTPVFTGCRLCMNFCLDPAAVAAGKPALLRDGDCADCAACDVCVENACYGDPGRASALTASQNKTACIPCGASGRLDDCRHCAICREEDGSWTTEERAGCTAGVVSDCQQYCSECVQGLRCYD